MEYYTAIRKVKIMQFAAIWIELEDMLSQVSQKEMDRDRIISYLFIMELKIHNNVETKKGSTEA